MAGAEPPAGAEGEDRPELVTFQVKAACVYTPLPPATSYGHRAELWDVEKWFREVRVRVVSVGDLLFIRLEELDTGELFAECPLPSDGTPLTRAVEPVVDSSRYYVLRVVDRADPTKHATRQKHAFLGLGFRERGESSAFSMALDEYRLYLKRKAEAEAMRKAHEQDEAQSSESGADVSEDGGNGGSCKSKFALPAGQTISIKLPLGTQKPASDTDKTSDSFAKRPVQRVFSLNETIAGVRLLPPPGSNPMRQASGRPAVLNDWAVFSDSLPSPDGTLMKIPSGEVPQFNQLGQLRAVEEQDDDEWGDFQTTAATGPSAAGAPPAATPTMASTA